MAVAEMLSLIRTELIETKKKLTIEVAVLPLNCREVFEIR